MLAVSAASCSHKEFELYKRRFNKLYESADEHAMRFNHWCKTVERLESHKKNYAGASFGLNKFSDMSVEEFKRHRTGMASFPNKNRNEVGKIIVDSCLAAGVTSAKPRSAGAVPTAWDWRQKGKVSPVKDQGQCGSCWTFSTTGNMESQYAIKNNKMILLSEQAVVDCSHACSNVTGYGPVCNQGCNGGWPWAAMADVKNWGGLPTESAYPYTAETGSCQIKGKTLNAPVTNVTCISGPKLASEADMQAWIVNHGPLSIAVNADPLQEYNGGILDPKHGCNPKQLDHAILIVGYGVENGKSFWIIKNSWGSDWGEDGYFRMVLGSGACGVNAAVSTVFM